MALLSYCIILYLVMTIDCAAIDENTTGENNDSNTNRKRALQGCEHSLCILEGSTCLQEEYNDRFASQLCEMNQNKRARTDSGTWTYPYSTESLSEQVMANNNSFFVSSAMNMPIQPTEIIYGNNPQSSSGCETYFACNPASTCTLLQTHWNQAPFDYRQANSCETSDFCNLSQTNYARQIDTQGTTNPNLLSKDERSAAGLAYSNLIQQTTSNEYSAPEVADLPSHATRHNVSSDQSRLSNPLRTDTNKFNQLLKWYQLEIECIKQSFGASKFKFRIISNDVLQFLILQATPLDKNHNQTVSHVSVSLPDFEYYYERCKESLSSKTKSNIIFSQKWSRLAERQAEFMMYTDLCGRIADLRSTLSKDQCVKRIKKISTKFCLDIVFVPSPAHDVKDNHYNPEDYFFCPVIARDAVNSYIPIDTEKYTLDNALDYFAEFAIFKQFVFDTFFSKHPSQVFHTIKEELWKLQVFISEIYLYLTWRLTITKNITVYEGQKKYGLKEEIKNLASLVDAFCKHGRPEILPSITLEALQDTVKKLRLDVLAMLKCHFGKSAMYQFYKIAHEPPVTSRYKNVHMRNRDILSMLAFAPKLPFCEASSQYIYKRDMNLETNINHFELGKFTHDQIGRNVPRKVEVTKILFATVKFIRELKPKATLSNEEKNCVIVFRYFSVFLSPGTDKQSLKVKFLSNCGFYVYFHRLLSELFAY